MPTSLPPHAYRLWLLILTITLTVILVLCVGVFAGRRWVNRVMAYDVSFSSVEASSTASRIGFLMRGVSAGEIGDMVFLNDVRLRPGPKPQVFIVSDATGSEMLVSLEAPKEFANLPTTVDIRGTLRRLPAAETLRMVWKLTKEQTQVFAKQQVYISVESVQSQSQDETTDASSSLTSPSL